MDNFYKLDRSYPTPKGVLTTVYHRLFERNGWTLHRDDFRGTPCYINSPHGHDRKIFLCFDSGDVAYAEEIMKLQHEDCVEACDRQIHDQALILSNIPEPNHRGIHVADGNFLTLTFCGVCRRLTPISVQSWWCEWPDCDAQGEDVWGEWRATVYATAAERESFRKAVKRWSMRKFQDMVIGKLVGIEKMLAQETVIDKLVGIEKMLVELRDAPGMPGCMESWNEIVRNSNKDL